MEAEQLEYYVTKTVEAEQYRYIQIDRDGDYRVELHSLQGDADLYVSDETTSPSYQDYQVKSTTCGDDVVYVPNYFLRPVYVGVYGHISYDQSKFILKVFSVDSEQDIFAENVYSYEQIVEGSEKKNNERSKRQSNPPNVPKGEEEESLVWTIFVGILKILLDVLV